MNVIPRKYKDGWSFKSIYGAVLYTLLVPIVFTVYVLFSYIFTAHTTNPNQFVDSMKNFPFGIFTSLFVFDGVSNVGGVVEYYVSFFLLILVILGIDVPVDREIVNKSIKHLALFSTIAMFAIAIMGNLFWVEIYRVGAYGQSGVLYSFAGIVISTAVALPIYVFAAHIDETRKLMIAEVVALAVILMLSYIIIRAYSSLLFNVSDGVAYPVHAFTFITGFFAGLVFWMHTINKTS